MKQEQKTNDVGGLKGYHPNAELFSRMELGRPRVSVFSGAAGRDTTPYDVWRYEVQCLKKDPKYPADIVMDAIRRNVRGDAARVVMHLGPAATPEQVLRKFDSVYGQVASQGSLLSTFHGAQQAESETVAEWCCRLEALMSQVEDGRNITRAAGREMMRSKLWTGLRSAELKAATRHKFDQLLDVDALLVAIRAAEHEVGGARRVVSRVMTTEPEKKEPSQLESTLFQITERLERMEVQMRSMQESQLTRERPYPPREGGSAGPIRCFKCGQEGHVAFGCRQQPPGNARPPTREGRQ